MLTRCLTVVLIAMLSFAATAQQAVPAMAGKPNIVIILADDMGFADIGCYGGEIPTPNIDRLAATGIRYTDFHNTARCWPSRAALMSGYYAQQVRRDSIPDFPAPAGNGGHRPAWAKLMPAYLKPLGYHSYHSGKWHIDGKILPAGFEHSYYVNDYDRNFYPRSHFLDDVKLPPVKPGENYYTSTAYADHAIQFLQGHAMEHPGEPFMLYLAFTAPHFPIQAPAEDIARYKGKYDGGWDALRQARFERLKQMGIVDADCALPPREPAILPRWNLPEAKLVEKIGPGEVAHAVAWDSLTSQQKEFQAKKMEVYAAMIDRMDREIGRVLDQVKAMGATDDTVVLFMSDNGASADHMIRGDGNDPTAPPGSGKSFLCLGPGWATAGNAPFRLYKSYVHEGGLSTPLIVSWPKGLAAHGELRRNPGHLVDIMPTVLELAGGHWPAAATSAPETQVPPPPPGKSLVPTFTKAGDGTVSHDYLWWFHEGHKAIRVGDLKAVSLGQGAPWELYDLKKDRSESHDLAGERADKVHELADLWQAKMDEFRQLALRDLPESVKKGKPKAEGKPEAD